MLVGTNGFTEQGLAEAYSGAQNIVTLADEHREEIDRMGGRKRVETLLSLPPRLWKALNCRKGDKRLGLLFICMGSNEAKSVSQIAALDPSLSLSVIARHLLQMSDAEILIREKRGKDVFYTVDSNFINMIPQIFYNHED